MNTHSKPSIPLSEFVPTSQLVVPRTTVPKPRFPVIDMHNHLGAPFVQGWDQRPVAELLETLDTAGIQYFVDLDGMWGEDLLHQHLDKYKAAAPDRFAVFGGINWHAWQDHGDSFGDWAARNIRQQAARGAQGIKVWKDFGLQVRDHNQQLVAIDDERLAPIWATAAELNLPIMVHIADPVAFFDPLTPENERLEELHAHPDWHFPSPPYPAFMTVIEDFAALVTKHPQTTFIGAHVGCYAENLAWVGALMDRCPNFHIDISARISELGRQPYTARRFFLQHADRIMFGTDAGPNPDYYRLMYRFLESEDEYFDYGLSAIPQQGRWRIYGLHLPEDVLQQVYQQNARQILNLP